MIKDNSCRLLEEYETDFDLSQMEESKESFPEDLKVKLTQKYSFQTYSYNKLLVDKGKVQENLHNSFVKDINDDRDETKLNKSQKKQMIKRKECMNPSAIDNLFNLKIIGIMRSSIDMKNSLVYSNSLLKKSTKMSIKELSLSNVLADQTIKDSSCKAFDEVCVTVHQILPVND